MIRFISPFCHGSIAVPEPALVYNLRVARIEDIPLIKACNEKTLPENYEYDVYRGHLHMWPSLTVVAENVGQENSIV